MKKTDIPNDVIKTEEDARTLLSEATQKRMAVCSAEIGEVLKKHNCRLSVVRTEVDGIVQPLQVIVQVNQQ